MSATFEGLLDLSKYELVPYQSPITPKNFGRLALNLLFVAFVLMSWFTMYVFLFEMITCVDIL
jgi:hypothetical protein